MNIQSTQYSLGSTPLLTLFRLSTSKWYSTRVDSFHYSSVCTVMCLESSLTQTISRTSLSCGSFSSPSKLKLHPSLVESATVLVHPIESLDWYSLKDSIWVWYSESYHPLFGCLTPLQWLLIVKRVVLFLILIILSTSMPTSCCPISQFTPYILPLISSYASFLLSFW